MVFRNKLENENDWFRAIFLSCVIFGIAVCVVILGVELFNKVWN